MSLGVSIQWLGHATFLLTGEDGASLLVDPFLASNPSCPEGLRELDRLDGIAITHGHADHCADVFDLCRSHADAPVVAMVEVAAWLRDGGIDEGRVVEMNKGGTVTVGGFAVTMVDANHSAGIQDGDSLRYGGEPAGLVISVPGGARVYHAGDTNVFGDMALIGELYAPDVALLPIGDRYTMGPREAAKACELLGVRRVVPMHWGTWPILTGRPQALREECAARGLDVDVIDMAPGDVWQ